ncbi:helix-turn-helix transcriptional regulator [Alkalicaulis satelles]|uniref:Helix-turn-helix transcriptional regulator n=1 Tax=Alkalicaulis satelles TaxID=2609175 RepID=A0A5M6ZIF4_9PROT|nr:helix-turn-helix transcriptional regulator [Alkalicaulis satelles]KAA5804603.1 helix-turn-helix transcriptional regulator [Alkalicaulis satelles]
MKNRIHVLRAEQRWSQAELGERVGVSRQAINAVETGKHDPSLALAFKIAEAFGLRIEDIFDPHG